MLSWLVCLFNDALISFPANSIHETAMFLASFVDVAVQNFVYFVFEVLVDLNRWWWGENTVWNGVWSCRFQLRDMEDWVNCVEMVRKLQGD